MKWLEALKEWNSTQPGRYTIPAKGSPGYLQVRAIQDSGSAPSAVSTPAVSAPVAAPVAAPVPAPVPVPRSAVRPLGGAGVAPAEPSAVVAPAVSSSGMSAATAAKRRKIPIAISKSGKDEDFIQEVIARMKTGAFASQAKRKGQEPLDFAKDILANPGRYTETTRRRAQFLVNIQSKA